MNIGATGERGEKLAARFLRRKGYRILERNFKTRFGEIDLIARKGDPYIGIPLKDLTSRKGSLVSVIVHQGKIIIPFGNDRIEEGDHVVVISSNPGISDLNEVLYR